MNKDYIQAVNFVNMLMKSCGIENYNTAVTSRGTYSVTAWVTTSWDAQNGYPVGVIRVCVSSGYTGTGEGHQVEYIITRSGSITRIDSFSGGDRYEFCLDNKYQELCGDKYLFLRDWVPTNNFTSGWSGFSKSHVPEVKELRGFIIDMARAYADCHAC